jgi:hypothetical protein
MFLCKPSSCERAKAEPYNESIGRSIEHTETQRTKKAQRPQEEEEKKKKNEAYRCQSKSF